MPALVYESTTFTRSQGQVVVLGGFGPAGPVSMVPATIRSCLTAAETATSTHALSVDSFSYVDSNMTMPPPNKQLPTGCNGR